MLTLDTIVPQALILPNPEHALAQLLAAQHAHWFSLAGETLHHAPETPERVTSLASVTSQATALKTNANAHGTPRAQNALAFAAEQHCGFMLEGAAPDARAWSCAIRYHSTNGDARTLLTLNPENDKNYIFLQHLDGQLMLKDRASSAELAVEAQGRTAPFDVIAGMSAGRLWLRVDRGEILTSGLAEEAAPGPATLFIGCRNNTPRLLKKLGDFLLTDLIFWPDRNVLAPDHRDDLMALDNLTSCRPSI